jgi:predicted histone-like DNA-binding protein
MPIFFNRIQKSNPSDPTAPRLWYLILKSTGLVKEKAVAKALADETTLNPKEAEMAVAQLTKVVVNLMLEGHTVQLGELGSLRLTAKSTGVELEENANANKINKLNVRFTESESLKEAIKKATFIDASTMSRKS